MQNLKFEKLRTVLAVLFLLFTIFSVIFVASEARHESLCTEDSCPICFVIQAVKANLSGLVLLLAVAKIIYHFGKSKKLKFSSINKSYISNTLFSLKIRLND